MRGTSNLKPSDCSSPRARSRGAQNFTTHEQGTVSALDQGGAGQVRVRAEEGVLSGASSVGSGTLNDAESQVFYILLFVHLLCPSGC
jgi:hypothetical protein